LCQALKFPGEKPLICAKSVPIYQFMPRKRTKFQPFKVEMGGKTYWQVNLESSYAKNEAGKFIRVRPRRTFSTAEEARGFASLKAIERKNRGVLGVSMNEKLRGDALAAQAVLEPFGASLLEAARYYASGKEASLKSESVKNAIHALLKAKTADGLRCCYIKDLRIRLTRFARNFGSQKLSDITPAEIDRWLRELNLAPLGRNTYRLRLGTLFEFARVNKWVTTNPIAEVSMAKVVDALPGILSVEQASRLLEFTSPETLPYHALGLFCGLRSAELERLTWSDIHFDENLVEVPSLASKTASRRFVSIRPNLAAWLEPYRGRTGKICPINLRYRLVADREAAGIFDWPSNAARHSYASYHLAAFRDAKELALEMGHSRSEITFRHYHQRVKPAEAIKYWQIVPAQSTPIAVVA
jgi:integrase